MQVVSSPEMRQIIETGCREIVKNLLAQAPADNAEELRAWWQEAQRLLPATAAEMLQQRWDNSGTGGELASMEADQVVVEVIDKKSGCLFRRELPLKYSETGNGILLAGEDMEGRPAVIAFFSGAAMSRLSELFGQGPDRARCGEHEHETAAQSDGK